ncbi:hypothetical protein U9M48_042212 [Paspalum notatum var. saurae]|uniref:F-box protein AT5G49610-like beta-propeller domain-containing protein n=1 Tax=Paspalum notatum var. saurae TaxID=547442 RepID=A0AAQ3XFY8_PASNO
MVSMGPACHRLYLDGAAAARKPAPYRSLSTGTDGEPHGRRPRGHPGPPPDPQRPRRLGRAACACACACACPTFRRVRASHPPLLLGFLLNYRAPFRPARPPYPSAPASRAVARAADFTFSFLPDQPPTSPSSSSAPTRRWEIRDARDGRVLLDLLLRDDGQARHAIFADVAVCDPVFRRFVVLPPIPDDLASAVQRPHVLILPGRKFEVFLLPLLPHEEETSFRVVWMAQCRTKLVMFIFSSVTGQWQSVASPTLQDLNLVTSSMDDPFLFHRSYAYGCFYWMMSVSPNFLVLDMATMEFSLLEYPPGFSWQESAIVEAGDGRLGMFSFNAKYGESFHLETFSTIRPYQAEGANEWKYIRGAELPYRCRYQMLGVANGRLLMKGEVHMEGDDHSQRLRVRSVALNTDYETVCGMIYGPFNPSPLPFLGYPPSLSSPSICASEPEEDDLREPAASSPTPTERGRRARKPSRRVIREDWVNYR